MFFQACGASKNHMLDNNASRLLTSPICHLWDEDSLAQNVQKPRDSPPQLIRASNRVF